jgi:hypothetical protein
VTTAAQARLGVPTASRDDIYTSCDTPALAQRDVFTFNNRILRVWTGGLEPTRAHALRLGTRRPSHSAKEPLSEGWVVVVTYSSTSYVESHTGV